MYRRYTAIINPNKRPANPASSHAALVGMPCRPHMSTHISAPQKTPKKPPINSTLAPNPAINGGGTLAPSFHSSWNNGGA